MKHSSSLTASLAAMCICAAAHADVAIDARVCLLSEATTIDSAGPLRIGTSEVRGIMDSTVARGRWDGVTVYCRSIWTQSEKEYQFSNRCTHVDRDGDRFFTTANGTARGSFRWTYIAGTGKYADVAGGGEAVLEKGYPKAVTTHGACYRVTGREQRRNTSPK